MCTCVTGRVTEARIAAWAHEVKIHLSDESSMYILSLAIKLIVLSTRVKCNNEGVLQFHS